MKWRDWQLLIILVLLLYIAVTLTLNIAGRPSTEPQDAAPLPTGTLRPTLEITVAVSVTRIVSPTTMAQPTSTPLPPPTRTATALPSPTAFHTPTASPEPLPTATPTVGTITHTVQKGENLVGIADRYGTTIQAIVRANDLANPDMIYIGQTLVIPLPAQPKPTATPSG